jgi:hypothetical protein
MRAFYLICLCALIALQIALVNLAHADWAACMETKELQWSPALLLPKDWPTLLAFILVVLPLTSFAVATSKPDLSAWFALLILLGATLYLMLPSHQLHDCDRKGSDAEFVAILLLPLSLIMTSILLLRRGMRGRKN